MKRLKLPKPLYHYTVGNHMESIFAAGEIRLADLYLEPNERPVVWFSTNPLMEPTARKGWIFPDGTYRTLSMQETHQRCGGLFRFRLSPTVRTFDMREYMELRGMSSWGFKTLVQCCRRQGANAQDWRVTFDAVDLGEIEAVEAWTGSSWIRITPEWTKEA